jgi:hypothetical protein
MIKITIAMIIGVQFVAGTDGVSGGIIIGVVIFGATGAVGAVGAFFGVGAVGIVNSYLLISLFIHIINKIINYIFFLNKL